MKQTLSITRKELNAYFGSPMALIFLGAFLAVTLFTFFWVETFFARGIADVRPLFRWMPLLLIFLVVVGIDGCVLRQVRAKEFVAHSAEMFGGSVIAAIALGSVVAVSVFLPVRLHPMFSTMCLLAMLFVLSRAIANYHVMR